MQQAAPPFAPGQSFGLSAGGIAVYAQPGQRPSDVLGRTVVLMEQMCEAGSVCHFPDLDGDCPNKATHVEHWWEGEAEISLCDQHADV